MDSTLREQADLRSLLGALWRRKFLLLGIFLTIPIAVYVISTQIPKTFEATTLLRIKAPTIDLSTLAPGTISTLETEALLAETEQVAKEAAGELGLSPSSADSLVGSVRVEPVSAASGGVTELIQLTATAEEGPRAAEIANAYAKALDTVRSRQALRQIDRAVLGLQEQKIEPDDVVTLDERDRQIQALRAARAGAEENTETIQPALAPEYPISPHPRRNAALAALVSLLLALGAVSLADRLDRRLRNSDQLEPLLGASLLSVIPSGAFPGAKPAPGPVREAFRTLAASLVYFNVDQPLSTIIVTSPTQGDGKTTVAVHLAGALVKDGQRVVLVDADLRNPQVAVRLGIEPSLGLAEVVTQGVPVKEALVDVAVGDRGGGRLQVLAAADQPPNPARLLGSNRMETVLGELARTADIVIIDTPPILIVSDAVPLLGTVSGVVVAAKVGSTSVDALLRLRQVLETVKSNILGAVATGAGGAGLYGYGSEYYTAAAEADADSAAEEIVAAPDAAVAAVVLDSADDEPKASGDDTETKDRELTETEREREDETPDDSLDQPGSGHERLDGPRLPDDAPVGAQTFRSQRSAETVEWSAEELRAAIAVARPAGQQGSNHTEDSSNEEPSEDPSDAADSGDTEDPDEARPQTVPSEARRFRRRFGRRKRRDSGGGGNDLD